MIFKETKLAGACVIELEKNTDAREYFARSWCKIIEEPWDRGLNHNNLETKFASKIFELYRVSPCA